jgi:hypothetical protein
MPTRRGTPQTPYDFAFEEVTLAILRLMDALASHDPVAIKRECTEARRAHRSMLDLYPKLQLNPSERDLLVGQLDLLRILIKQCEKEPPQRIRAAGGRT